MQKREPVVTLGAMLNHYTRRKTDCTLMRVSYHATFEMCSNHAITYTREILEILQTRAHIYIRAGCRPFGHGRQHQ